MRARNSGRSSHGRTAENFSCSSAVTIKKRILCKHPIVTSLCIRSIAYISVNEHCGLRHENTTNISTRTGLTTYLLNKNCHSFQRGRVWRNYHHADRTQIVRRLNDQFVDLITKRTITSVSWKVKVVASNVRLKERNIKGWLSSIAVHVVEGKDALRRGPRNVLKWSFVTSCWEPPCVMQKPRKLPSLILSRKMEIIRECHVCQRKTRRKRTRKKQAQRKQTWRYQIKSFVKHFETEV